MKIVKAYNSVSLIVRILCGLIIGVVLGLLFDNLFFLISAMGKYLSEH